MTPILDNAVLANDLDCQNYDLRNIGTMEPVPENLVGINDPSLSGGRTMAAGSVTNDSVNATASIDQSKLNLNLNIPSDWTIGSIPGGDGIPRAAAGNLSELMSRKGVPNGYAGLDADGKIAVSYLTPGDAVGSITSIGMRFKYIWNRDPLAVHPQTITTSGTFTVTWVNNPGAACWFGSDGTLDPQHHEFTYPFFVPHAVEENMMSVPATKFVIGVFPTARLPLAKGMGVAPPAGQTRIGMVPNPGPTGARTMYLGRDMNWHHFVVNNPAVAHQPTAPDVTIVLDSWKEHKPTPEDPSKVKAFITIRSLLGGSSLFYRVTPESLTPLGFHKAVHKDTPDDVHITVEVNEYDFVEAYAAKQGYNNSDVEEWQVITPITDLNLS
jgi:hypothetical protein